MQAVGEPLGVAYQAGTSRIVADAHQDALAGRPRALDGVGLHFREQLLVHPLGRAAQSELAQRGQVGRREEVLERALGLLGDVDLAFLESLDQIVGRQVDQLDGIGAIEHGIRHRLAHAHMRDLRDHVIEALDVLDIDRRVDVDAVTHQFFDVEIALRVAAAFDVGVCELIDQDDCGRRAMMASRSISSSDCSLYSMCRRGTISRPSNSASVSLRPWVSTMPITTS
jgi:hypothetical protein